MHDQLQKWWLPRFLVIRKTWISGSILWFKEPTINQLYYLPCKTFFYFLQYPFYCGKGGWTFIQCFMLDWFRLSSLMFHLSQKTEFSLLHITTTCLYQSCIFPHSCFTDFLLNVDFLNYIANGFESHSHQLFLIFSFHF